MGSKGQGLQFFLDDLEGLTKELERMMQRYEGFRDALDASPQVGRVKRRTLDMWYRSMLNSAETCLDRTKEAVEKTVCDACGGSGHYLECIGNEPTYVPCDVCSGTGLRQQKCIDTETMTSVPF